MFHVTQEKVTKRRTRFKGAAQEGMARLVDLRPYNDNQKLYLNYLHTHPQILVTGYSGTGKTFLAASYAANMYAAREIDKIIITRPNISVGKDLGYFPGTLEEKIAPWVAPVLDVLTEQLGKGVVDTAIKSGNIEMAPLSTMRGRSFKNSFVLMDEAQNLTIPEMKMFLTRVGQNCKVVINGDIRQSDIKDNSGSGLAKIIHLVKKYNMDVPTVEFGIDDIVRSDICKQWIIAFEEDGL
jgi:phosphate starvation-inducible PhoH-like protein